MRCLPPCNKRHRRAGLTLVDLTVVVLILGILAAVATPRYAASQAEFRVKLAAQRIAADLRMARRDALAQSAARSVFFRSGPTCGYTIPDLPDLNRSGGAYQVDLSARPYSILDCIADFGSLQTIEFNGHGIPNSGGSVTIRTNSGRAVVRVNPQTGEVVIP